MGLNNYQLVLLDNLIYLDEVVRTKGNNRTIGDIVHDLLYDNGSSVIGSGTITQDCKNPYKDDDDLCMMSKDEWIEVLRAIEADAMLCDLVVHQVANDTSGDTNGFRAMALTNGNLDENVIIFRGTTSATEWIDNGKGGAEEETACQRRALEFVSQLDIVNNNSFVVSGHSKGGNLAQYVALFSMDPPFDRCLSFDGQGFSNELCSTPAYQEAIERHGNNLYLIAACGDYVNVLFNSPVPESHRMYVDTSLMLNPTKYHKPNAVFCLTSDPDWGYEKERVTNLNGIKTMTVFSIFVQDFISYVGEHASVEERRAIYDGLMLLMASNADDHDDLELAPISMNKILSLFVMQITMKNLGILGLLKIDDMSNKLLEIGENINASAQGELRNVLEMVLRPSQLDM